MVVTYTNAIRNTHISTYRVFLLRNLLSNNRSLLYCLPRIPSTPRNPTTSKHANMRLPSQKPILDINYTQRVNRKWNNASGNRIRLSILPLWSKTMSFPSKNLDNGTQQPHRPLAQWAYMASLVVDENVFNFSFYFTSYQVRNYSDGI